MAQAVDVNRFSARPSERTSVLGRASSHVVLAGEYASAYGYPTVAVGLDGQTRAYAMPGRASEPCRLRVASLGIEVAEGDPHPAAAGLDALLEALRHRRPVAELAFEVTTDAPAFGALGTATAIGMALTRALAPTATEAEQAELALTYARAAGSVATSDDAIVAARGGCLSFELGRAPTPLSVKRPAFLCIGVDADVGGSMVRVVAARRARAHKDTDQTLRAIGGVSTILRAALEDGDYRDVGRLMNENQYLLQRLDLTTAAVHRMCVLARTAGAVGTKATGSDASGCVVALTTDAADAHLVIRLWSRESFRGIVYPLPVTRSL